MTYTTMLTKKTSFKKQNAQVPPVRRREARVANGGTTRLSPQVHYGFFPAFILLYRTELHVKMSPDAPHTGNAASHAGRPTVSHSRCEPFITSVRLCIFRKQTSPLTNTLPDSGVRQQSGSHPARSLITVKSASPLKARGTCAEKTEHAQKQRGCQNPS